MLKPESEERMIHLPGIIQIDKKEYAVNLLWSEVPNDKKYKKIIKNRLKLLGGELYCIDRCLTGRQYAIADESLGHKKGLRVLGSCFDNHGKSLCGLYEHDGIWLIFAIDRNGFIVMDKASHERNDSIVTYNALLADNQWDEIVCPAGLGISGSHEGDISQLLNKKGIKLSTIGIERFYPVVKITGAGAISIAACYLSYSFFVDKQIVTEQPMVTVAPSEPEKINVPWGGRSHPESLLRECINSVEIRTLDAAAIPGWSVKPNAVCDDNGIHYTIKKEFGLNLWTENDNYKSFFVGNNKPELRPTSENTANLSWRLRLDRYDTGLLDLEQLEPSGKIKKQLMDLFEYYFIPVTIKPASAVNGGIQEIKFSVSLTMEPTIILPILLQVKNLVIDKLYYDYSDNHWVLDATFWEKNNV
ncbi:hypothetical protein AB5F15_004869 [Escherichia coli]|uniref:hypothetical protein n=1 Tax=Escherichia coli TaxID=562 RepID=UPI0018482C99|nr:hypothetical protein [Escherichia coli]EFH2521655.1 hypothetical protein [Escherichia coli]EFL2231765.1 hypothetical protein [Escherichia coli]EFV2006279.1 hypothetical protein [Escherichia coli]EKR7160333.1 hypothetical protein [Escherichia coli]